MPPPTPATIDHQLNAHEENPAYYEAGRESDDETGRAQPDPGTEAPQRTKRGRYNQGIPTGDTIKFNGIILEMSQKVVPNGLGSNQIRYAEDGSMREMVQNIQGILECRPVTTVRAILDLLGPVCQTTVGKALPICGYMFANGPWKKALIKFGVDPRIQPNLRFYQTITFDMEFDPVVERGKHDWTVKGNLAFPQLLKADDNIPHIFNGRKFVADDNTWQICDITDEILHRVIATSEARLNLSNKAGFFLNGTMAKIMVIMRDKLLCIRDNLLLDDSVYGCLLGFPDEYVPPKGRDIRRYGLEFGQHYTTKQAFLRGRIVDMARRLL